MKTFECAMCGSVCNTNSSEEEKEAEFFKRYGHSIAECDEEVVSLCDDCEIKFKQLELKELDNGAATMCSRF